jgi:hypothetical protein
MPDKKSKNKGSSKRKGNEKRKGKEKITKKNLNNQLNSLKMNNSNIKYDFDVVKKNVRSFLINVLIVTIIAIIYLAFILYYLHNLKKCKCFLEENETSININYLIIIESIIMAFQVVVFIYILSLLGRLENFNGGSRSTGESFFMFIYFILYFLIYGYFIYYVYLLSQKMPENCECANSPIKYLLYLQTIIIFINLVMTLIGIFGYAFR